MRCLIRGPVVGLFAAVAAIAGLCSCEQRETRRTTATTQPVGEVVVYATLDREFSQPILDEFTQRTGIAVRAVYDAESTKTIGLVNRIRAEKERPRCDVFWNSEIVNTLRLKQEGLLARSTPAGAAAYPAQFRDPEGYWYGFAARARVLIVNTDLVPADQRPTSIRDLGNPRWKGRVGIAKPLFGTTASHVACLFTALGPRDAAALLDTWKSNDIVVTGGNKGAAEAVGAGKLAFALTDTDDALAEVDAKHPVAIVFPDQAPSAERTPDPNRGAEERRSEEAKGVGNREDQRSSPVDNAPEPLGTLLLPNTVAIVHGAPNAANAERLVDYLLSADTEARLAACPSAQIPLQPGVATRSRAVSAGDILPMKVDFSKAADAFAEAAKYVEERFLQP